MQVSFKIQAFFKEFPMLNDPFLELAPEEVDTVRVVAADEVFFGLTIASNEPDSMRFWLPSHVIVQTELHFFQDLQHAGEITRRHGDLIVSKWKWWKRFTFDESLFDPGETAKEALERIERESDGALKPNLAVRLYWNNDDRCDVVVYRSKHKPLLQHMEEQIAKQREEFAK